MNDAAPSSFTGLVLRMAVFVVLGAPLVGYLWETISTLLALRVHGTQLLIALPALLLFISLMMWMSRVLRQWLPYEP